MYKYFTWKSGKYFEGQDLLSINQIRILRNKVVSNNTEAYSTIQDYDQEGNTIGCNLYFDIDADNIFDAYESMVDLYNNIACDYSVSSYIWFSGSKGFHIIAPLYIKHDRCHEIARDIAKSYRDDNIDMKVYRTRSMLRMHNTVNNKTGMFKVPVTVDQKIKDMLYNAKNRNIITIDYSNTKQDSFEFVEEVDGIIKLLPDPSLSRSMVTGINFYDDMNPCLKTLWLMDCPPEGSRHQLCHMVSRHCLISGMSKEEAVKVFSLHNFWSTVDDRDYEKVISSVYKRTSAFIGCKSGSDSDLLKPHCIDRCIFNDNFNKVTRFGWTEKECERENNRNKYT